MKILFLAMVLGPAIAAAQSYKCIIDDKSFIKLKINDEYNITAEITHNKKVATSCLFNAELAASDPNGRSAHVIQNFVKTGCSKLEGKKVFKVSDEAYTKITHDKKKGSVFYIERSSSF